MTDQSARPSQDFAESGLIYLLADLAESAARAVGHWALFVELLPTDPDRAMDRLIDLDIALQAVMAPNVAEAQRLVADIRRRREEASADAQ